MKKRIALIAVLIAIAAPLAVARPHRGPGLIGHLQKMKAELGLTEQQSERIKAIMTELRAQNAPYREQLHGVRKGVAAMLLADPANVAAAQAVLDQQASAERAMKTNRLNATAKALAVLNAEQRAELGEKLEQFAERRAQRRRRR